MFLTIFFLSSVEYITYCSTSFLTIMGKHSNFSQYDIYLYLNIIFITFSKIQILRGLWFWEKFLLPINIFFFICSFLRDAVRILFLIN